MNTGKRTRTVNMQKSDIEIVDIPNGTQRVLRFGDKLVQGRMNKDGSLSLDYFKQLMHAFEHIEVCILGLGAGCLHRYIHKNYPDVQIDTVEILPELVEIAREKFYLPDSDRIRIFIEDARTWVKKHSGYDIVIVDLYDEWEQVYIDDRDLKKLGKLIAYNSLINKNTYEGYMIRLRAVYNNVYEQFKPELKEEEYNHIAFCK